jgi:hypothetical protein
MGVVYTDHGRHLKSWMAQRLAVQNGLETLEWLLGELETREEEEEPQEQGVNNREGRCKVDKAEAVRGGGVIAEPQVSETSGLSG